MHQNCVRNIQTVVLYQREDRIIQIVSGTVQIY
jgi:hypothetical protein